MVVGLVEAIEVGEMVVEVVVVGACEVVEIVVAGDEASVVVDSLVSIPRKVNISDFGVLTDEAM